MSGTPHRGADPPPSTLPSTSGRPPGGLGPPLGVGGPGGEWVYESRGGGHGRRWRWREHRQADAPAG
eukprot:8132769-Alexandrium_andersonii.AAC.1